MSLINILKILFLLSIVSSAHAATQPVSAPLLWQQIQSAPEWVILDVRTSGEFKQGHIPNAINVPYDQLAAQLTQLKLKKEQTIVVYCRSGRRAAIAMDVLKQHGYNQLVDLEGDMNAWQSHALPLEK